MYTGDIMSFFPLESPRSGQTAVITEIDKVIKAGKKLIILEAPVGSGKSGIAMTFARAFEQFGGSHLITPRKSLQDQYYDDFSDDVVLMKGRGSYPCTFYAPNAVHRAVIQSIKTGKVAYPDGMGDCGTAPCRNSTSVYQNCTETRGLCPYTAAIETAQSNSTIIHNLHSFIFQTSFSGKFEKRSLLVIDEAHDIEGILREFISKKFTIEKDLKEEDIPASRDLDKWCEYFLSKEVAPPPHTQAEKDFYGDKPTPYEQYLEKVSSLGAAKEFFQDRFAVRKTQILDQRNKVKATTFEFVPESLGNTANNLLFSYGEYVLLMSGTIVDKALFCRNLGVDPESAHFIRISSSFPKENRPIYLKSEYQVDTSFANWNDNFEEMIDKMKKIMAIFDDAKGLIHAPSYEAAMQITIALNTGGGGRAITHTPKDFQTTLENFYKDERPLVLVSPVCQQGVDFKEDRARFQIVTRIPYLNSSDEFIKHKVETDFMWYNFQALVVFGQQLGRVNRSEEDYGATFLLDSRFNRFILKNTSKIPKWVQNGMIWK